MPDKLKQLEMSLNASLQDLKNDEKATEYANCLTTYLQSNIVTAEVVSIIVKGMDIDRGANFADYLEGVSQKDLINIWKSIKKSVEIKIAKNGNGIKFLSCLFYLAMIKVGMMGTQLGNILAYLTTLISEDNTQTPLEIYGPIVKDYIFCELPDNYEFPKWEDIKAADTIKKSFSEKMLEAISSDREGKLNFRLKMWLSSGVKFADDAIARKELEEKIPKSQISELNKIADHYLSVERQLRDAIYKIDYLEKEKESLLDQISCLNEEKTVFQEEIRGLKTNIEAIQGELQTALEEVETRKKINDTADALNDKEKEAIRREVASDLKTEYLDFMDSVGDPMDDVLGEIYREKIKNIFRILGKKGIKVE